MQPQRQLLCSFGLAAHVIASQNLAMPASYSCLWQLQPYIDSCGTLSLLQVRVKGVKNGKVDVTQRSEADAASDKAAEQGVSTIPAISQGASLFEFALSRAGVQSRAFETNVRPPPICADRVLIMCFSGAPGLCLF